MGNWAPSCMPGCPCPTAAGDCTAGWDASGAGAIRSHFLFRPLSCSTETCSRMQVIKPPAKQGHGQPLEHFGLLLQNRSDAINEHHQHGEAVRYWEATCAGQPCQHRVVQSVSTDLHLYGAYLNCTASKTKGGKTLEGNGWQHLKMQCRHTISNWCPCGSATVQVPQHEPF